MFSERSVGFPFSPCGFSVDKALGEGSALAAVPILAEFQNLLGSFYKIQIPGCPSDLQDQINL